MLTHKLLQESVEVLQRICSFVGEISGSVTFQRSFGRIEADFLHGDGSSIKDSLSRSTRLLSRAAQIASRISGSFTSGFGYEGTIQTAPGGVWRDSYACFPGGRSDRSAVIGIQKLLECKSVARNTN